MDSSEALGPLLKGEILSNPQFHINQDQSPIRTADKGPGLKSTDSSPGSPAIPKFL
jgi:hypothetical protein